jgi:hypothetical protein
MAKIGEAFLNAPKTATAAAVNTQDTVIAASPFFQHGCATETLRRALTRNPDGSAAGPLGQVSDFLKATQT